MHPGCRQADAARHMLRASGTTLVDPGFLAVYQEGRDDDARGRRRPQAAADERRRRREARWRCTPNSISPSRRRASRKPRWSRRSRNTASAARRPTPPSSRRCATANTWTWTAAASRHRRRHDREPLPVQVLHPVRRLRLHRRDGRRARRGLPRRGGLGPAAGEILEAVQGPGRGNRDQRQPRGSRDVARPRHPSGIRQAGVGAPGPLRPVRADRHQGRRGEAEVRRPAPRPEDGHDHAGRCAGAVQAAAQARRDGRWRTDHRRHRPLRSVRQARRQVRLAEGRRSVHDHTASAPSRSSRPRRSPMPTASSRISASTTSRCSTAATVRTSPTSSATRASPRTAIRRR